MLHLYIAGAALDQPARQQTVHAEGMAAVIGVNNPLRFFLAKLERVLYGGIEHAARRFDGGHVFFHAIGLPQLLGGHARNGAQIRLPPVKTVHLHTRYGTQNIQALFGIVDDERAVTHSVESWTVQCVNPHAFDQAAVAHPRGVAPKHHIGRHIRLTRTQYPRQLGPQARCRKTGRRRIGRNDVTHRRRVVESARVGVPHSPQDRPLIHHRSDVFQPLAETHPVHGSRHRPARAEQVGAFHALLVGGERFGIPVLDLRHPTRKPYDDHAVRQGGGGTRWILPFRVLLSPCGRTQGRPAERDGCAFQERASI